MTESLEQRVRHLEDYLEIMEVKSRYCKYLDIRNPDPADAISKAGGIAVLFAEDGVLDNRPGGPYAVGRAAIRDMYFARRGNVLASSHNVVNPIIRIDGDNAVGEWHGIFYSRSGAPDQTGKTEQISFGTYHDEFVRTPEGWRIKSLKLVFTSDRPGYRPGNTTPESGRSNS